MIRKSIITLMICCLVTINLMAQKSDSTHRSHYSLNVGVGWTHYINTFEVAKENVSPDYVGLNFRFFWEPGYRVALGLETGYMRLYRFNPTVETSAKIDLNLVPLLLVARMRIVDRVYLSAGTGLTYMSNRIKSPEGNMTNPVWSLANYEFNASYIYPLGKRFRIAGEAGTFYLGKTNDWMYYIQGIFGIVF